MRFVRPVDLLWPIKSQYADIGDRYGAYLDQETGLWGEGKGTDGVGHHNGTDYDCPVGTVVRAMSDGFIVRSHYEDSAGLYILQLVSLLGFDSWVLRYSHLQSSYVAPGQPVKRGEGIAQSGMSGKCLSPYLHVDLMNLHRQWRPISLDD